jgi:hypothetical protein
MEPKQDKYKDAVLMVDLAYTPLSQRGSGEPAIVTGYGDGLPFDDAVTMVMPTGWHLYRDKLLDQKSIPENVSFTGGVPWPDVFKQIGGRYALHFHIDWFDRTVLMSKGRVSNAMRAATVRVIQEPASPATAPYRAAGNATPIAAGGATPIAAGTTINNASKSFAPPVSGGPAMVTTAGTSGPTPVTTATSFAATSPASAKAVPVTAVSPTSKPVAVYAPAPAPAPVQAWDAKVGQSLRGVITAWSKKAGYDVHWATEDLDYPIDSPLHFEGSYEQAIKEIFHLYEKAERPFVVSGSRPGKRLDVSEDISKSTKSAAL